MTSSVSDEDVSVVIDDATSYQKTEDTTLDTIEPGACVRITGTGRVKKGIAATSIALVNSDDGECGAGALGRDGQAGPTFGGGGDGQTPPSLPDDLPQGSGPPGSFPGGGPNGQGGDGTGEDVTTAFGTVKKVTDTDMIVKAAIVGRPAGADDQPRVKTRRVNVTVGDDTVITETVDAIASEVTVGSCVSASGVGDSEAFTAEQVTISQPDDEGECTGVGGGGFFPGGGGGGFPGGGFPGGGPTPPSGDDSGDQAT